MILSRRVALGGVQLDEIHDAVVIRGVDTGVPHETVSAVNRMGGAGQRMTAQHWETLEVAVTYAIDVSMRQMELRREIFDAVNSWALRGGWLTTTSQPGKRVWVEKVVVPGPGDLRDWTNDYTITFRAYGVPFWQEEVPTPLVIGSVARGNLNMEVKGNVRTVADMTARNISGQVINQMTLGIGDSSFTLSGIALGGAESLVISHTENGLLQIRAGNRDVYHLRTPESSDDLYVDPGIRMVRIEIPRAVQLTVRAAGRFV